MYYVYMLWCRDDTLYTGTASDLCRRMRQHRERLYNEHTRFETEEHAVGLLGIPGPIRPGSWPVSGARRAGERPCAWNTP